VRFFLTDSDTAFPHGGIGVALKALKRF
jgi:hypothetical protein